MNNTKDILKKLRDSVQYSQDYREELGGYFTTLDDLERERKELTEQIKDIKKRIETLQRSYVSAQNQQFFDFGDDDEEPETIEAIDPEKTQDAIYSIDDALESWDLDFNSDEYETLKRKFYVGGFDPIKDGNRIEEIFAEVDKMREQKRALASA